jgi:hypothetical protein
MESDDLGAGTSGYSSRAELLMEAARQVDLRMGHLGGGGPLSETPEGAMLRALSDDVAEFASFPVVYRITDRDFLSRSMPVPLRFTELARRFRFYWLYVPIGLFPQRNWGFNRLEVLMEFNAGEARPELRPKAYQILPEKRFQKLLEVGIALNVRLDENFEFSADVEPVPQVPGMPASLRGAVDAKAAGSMGMVAGPFTYRVKRAQIDHTPVGMEKVRWRIDGAEFFGEDSPEPIVILQVPTATREVTITAALEASRYFNYASASLQDAIKELGASLRQFFRQGAPLQSTASWDISASL